MGFKTDPQDWRRERPASAPGYRAMPKEKDPPESLADQADLPEGKTVTGRLLDPETGETIDRPEAEHFTRCDICGGMYDMRDLAAVIHHDAKRHDFQTDPEWDRVKGSSSQ